VLCSSFCDNVDVLGWDVSCSVVRVVPPNVDEEPTSFFDTSDAELLLLLLTTPAFSLTESRFDSSKSFAIDSSRDASGGFVT